MSQKVTAALLITAAVFIALGTVSAVLVLVGVLSPLDLPVIDLANFIGYVLWSIWLVVFGLLLLRGPHAGTAAPARARSTAEGR
jgi:fatty acid desaturase